MNAQELTEKYLKDHQRLSDLEKEVEYLKQEYEKQRMILNDALIDIKMLQSRK